VLAWSAAGGQLTRPFAGRIVVARYPLRAGAAFPQFATEVPHVRPILGFGVCAVCAFCPGQQFLV